MSTPLDPGAAPDEGAAPAVPVFASVEEFVTEFLAPTVARKLSTGGRGLTWCPQWWMHAEAIARLMALWEAWEALRNDGGTAMSTWWTDHLGPHLAVLMDAETGPLHLCRPTTHGGAPAPLPTTPAPDRWWGIRPS